MKFSKPFIACAISLGGLLASCREVPVYSDRPAHSPPVVYLPPESAAASGDSRIIYVNPGPYDAVASQGSLNRGPGWPADKYAPLPRPNLATDSPEYWTDPRLPTNRGQWETIRGPNGKPMKIYPTDVDPRAPDASHRSGLPAGSGFEPANRRWNQQQR